MIKIEKIEKKIQTNSNYYHGRYIRLTNYEFNINRVYLN